MDFLALVVAVIAALFARKAMQTSRELRAKLEQIEGRIARGEMPAIPETTTTTQEAEHAPPIVPVTDAETQGADEPPHAPAVPPPLPPEALAPAAAATPTLAKGPGFEEWLGTRWVVWIGGLTLALGGVFLVRYSIEQGLISPAVRIALGALFSAALLAAGEWARRKEALTSIAPLPIANIPAILTAAGTVSAFATAYASYALYDFLAPASAFILLAIVAFGTLAAALLHGPALAGLGLVAAFVAPALVSSEEPSYWALYLYLAFVTAAAFALARARMWRWLALTTIVFALLWLVPGLDGVTPAMASTIFHVVAGFALACALVVCGLLFGPAATPGRIEPISSTSLAAYLFGALAIVLANNHADAAMIAFALLGAATLAVAWRSEAAAGAVGAASAITALVFLSWAVRANTDMLVLPGGPLPGIAPLPTDASVSLHLATGLGFALAFLGAGYAAQGRSSSAAIPIVWAASGVFAPLAILIALYATIAHFDRSIPFAIIAVVLAAAFGLATERLDRREAHPGQTASTALFATGALAALSLALTFALEKGWLTIALALTCAATAWVATQRPVPFLRWLAAILAAIVGLRIGYEPRIASDAMGTTPVFNWILWGYGVPAAAFWFASVRMRRKADDVPLRFVESAAVLATALFAFMEIRHFVTRGDIYDSGMNLVEVGLDVCVALAMAIGLERLRERSGSIVHNVAAVLLTVFAGLLIVGGLMVLQMPAIWHINVGGPILNTLLLAYALPAVLALALSYAAGQRPTAYVNTIAAFALLLALTYITLEVMRLYHGPVPAIGFTSDAEQYTYSLAWLAFGLALLGAGFVTGSRRARLASAVVIALTIGKAFLIDMSSLTGIWRALSFMGLGLVLVGIGWFYQRILFRARAAQAAPPPEIPN